MTTDDNTNSKDVNAETAENPITDPDVALILRDLMKRMKFAKTETCRENGITDNPALFLCVWDSDEDDDEHEGASEYATKLGLSRAYRVGLIPLIHKEDVLDSFMDVVKSLPIQPFRYIFIAVEGYLDEGMMKGDKSVPKEYERGDMAKEYAENPFTTIREAVIVSGVNWEGNKAYNVFSTYKYGDNGLPKFEPTKEGESDIDDETSGGRFLDAMVATSRFMNMAVKAKAFHNLLTDDRANEQDN